MLAKLQTLLISVLDVNSQLLYRSKRRRKSHINALGVLLLGELQSRYEHGGEEENSCPWQELNSSHKTEVTALTDMTQLIIDLNLV